MGNTLTIYQMQRQYKRLLLFFPKLIFPGAVLISLGLHGVVLMWPLPEKPEEEEVVEEELIEEVPIAILDVPAESETKSSNKEIPLPSFASSPPPKTIPPVQLQPIQEDVVIEPIEIETVSDVDKKDDLPEENKSNNKGTTSSDSGENDDSDSQQNEGDDGEVNGEKSDDEKNLEALKAKAQKFTGEFNPNGTPQTGERFEQVIYTLWRPLFGSEQQKKFEKQVKVLFPDFDPANNPIGWFGSQQYKNTPIGVISETNAEQVFDLLDHLNIDT